MNPAKEQANKLSLEIAETIHYVYPREWLNEVEKNKTLNESSKKWFRSEFGKAQQVRNEIADKISTRILPLYLAVEALEKSEDIMIHMTLSEWFDLKNKALAAIQPIEVKG